MTGPLSAFKACDAYYEIKVPKFEFKTQPKQHLGYLPLNIVLHTATV
jgi:hypothetical protein